MSTSDAFVVGESWLSEHFFTADSRSQSFLARVLERRAGWDAELVDAGSSPRTRFLEQRGELQTRMADLSQRVEALAEQAAAADEALDARALADDADAVAEQVLAVLGMEQHGLQRSGSGGPHSTLR